MCAAATEAALAAEGPELSEYLRSYDASNRTPVARRRGASRAGTAKRQLVKLVPLEAPANVRAVATPAPRRRKEASRGGRRRAVPQAEEALGDGLLQPVWDPAPCALRGQKRHKWVDPSMQWRRRMGTGEFLPAALSMRIARQHAIEALPRAPRRVQLARPASRQLQQLQDKGQHAAEPRASPLGAEESRLRQWEAMNSREDENWRRNARRYRHGGRQKPTPGILKTRQHRYALGPLRPAKVCVLQTALASIRQEEQQHVGLARC